MKRIFIVLAIVAGLIGCKKEETPVTPEQEQDREVEYSVVEESDIESAVFFDTITSNFTETQGLDLVELKQAYEAAEAAQEIDTEAQLPGVSNATAPLLYHVSKITYTTKDAANKDVKVSALVIYPRLRKISKVLLINHGTHIGKLFVPTLLTDIEAIAAASGALCILPDYIGLGESVDHPELYLNAEVHGTTSTDALFALLTYAKRQNLKLKKDYDTYILGYSQGGSVSLATLRTIQSLPAHQRNQLRLKKVICGDGPYDLRCTFDSFVADEDSGKTMGLGAVIPMVINSMFNSYPEEMGKFNYEDFFTTWALSTGVPQAIRNNTVTLAQIKELNGVFLSNILNMDYVTTDTTAYNTLLAMMDRQNLCNGWSPSYPVQFFHCNPDGIVTYNNFVNAYAGLQNNYVLTPETPSSASQGGVALKEHIYGMGLIYKNFLLGKYY